MLRCRSAPFFACRFYKLAPLFCMLRYIVDPPLSLLPMSTNLPPYFACCVLDAPLSLPAVSTNPPPYLHAANYRSAPFFACLRVYKFAPLFNMLRYRSALSLSAVLWIHPFLCLLCFGCARFFACCAIDKPDPLPALCTYSYVQKLISFYNHAERI